MQGNYGYRKVGINARLRFCHASIGEEVWENPG